jgi:DNA polymerase-1
MRPAGGGAKTTLYLVDGNAQFHRAYHAIRGLATSRGLPTNATYGFTTMLRKLDQDEHPTHIGISFDPPGSTFRHEQYAEYKANRKRMDDDLAVQLPYVRRVCEVLKIPILELPGYEADDVIATLTAKAVAAGWRVVVVSGDKDLLQLVSDEVTVLNPGRDGMGAVRYDRAKVEEKWGVPPERIVDVLALMGDSVDNIPGVAGIGDKGARDLVREYGPVEAVLDNADKVKRAAYREGLKTHRAEALLSKDLATLRQDAPIALDLEALKRHPPDRGEAHALFSELEFQAIAKEYVPDANPSAAHHRVAASEADLQALVGAARAAGRVSLAIVGTHPEPMRAQVLGLSLAVAPGGALYVPLGHESLEGPAELAPVRALEVLKPLLEDAGVRKLSANAKRDLVLLAQKGVRGAGWTFDALLAAYLLNPGRRAYSLDELSVEFVGERRATGAETAGPSASVEATATTAGQDADVVLRMADLVTARLAEEQLDGVYASMEMPLAPVLADLELAGVKIDTPLLASMSRDMERLLEGLTREIHSLAKGEFNINSPIQLREILFDRLGLQSGKKTAKTRAASTAEDVLEELALVHELPRKILDYRSVQKLKSTYVDALPSLVNPKTGRIHASFNQTVAATGRISASDPNLQNIPIRTAEGRRIREAFVAEPGHLLLSADYSQIELRILAHLSKDETLIDTFRRGEDVHDRTSREIFGPLSPVPPLEQRRISKMVNYALLYGKTAFTLATDIGVSRKEAQTFIDAYFARYPAVRRFIDETIARARETGTVRTLLGRLRRLPDLRSKNVPIRMEAERQAMNTPVQGSAADLIKKAMIDLHRELQTRGMKSRLILQIHDELLLETPEAEAERASRLVKETMEGALTLDVPLVADARVGRNWAEVH